MQINDIVIGGRLVDDVDYRALDNDKTIATFKFANNRGKHTNYLRIASFGKVALYAERYLKKSQRVTIQGVLNHHENKDKNGKWHDYYTVIAKTFDPIKRRKQTKTDRDLYAKLNSLNKKVDKVSATTGAKRK